MSTNDTNKIAEKLRKIPRNIQCKLGLLLGELGRAIPASSGARFAEESAQYLSSIGITVSEDREYVTGGVRFQIRQIGDKLEVRVITEGQPAPSTDPEPTAETREDDETTVALVGNCYMRVPSGRYTTADPVEHGIEPTAETRGDEGFGAWRRKHWDADEPPSKLAREVYDDARAELLSKVAGVRAELERQRSNACYYANPAREAAFWDAMIIFNAAFPSGPGEVKL